MDLELHGKVALVTGAGSGIGEAIATALAGEGCIVYFGDSNAGAAERVVRRWTQRAHAIALDVGDAYGLKACAKQITHEQGRIDILVNNAGVLKTGSVVDATIADWDEVCRVNLSGVYYCCKAVLPGMIERKYGKIVNIASVSAEKGGGAFGNALYGATKAGVVALTKGMARDLGPFGINVNAIAPAVADTGMTSRLLTPERRQAIIEKIPLGRLASPADIARVACILASDAFSYITGETIAVDGGFLTR